MTPAPHLKGFIAIIAEEVVRQIRAEERAAAAEKHANSRNEEPHHRADQPTAAAGAA